MGGASGDGIESRDCGTYKFGSLSGGGANTGAAELDGVSCGVISGGCDGEERELVRWSSRIAFTHEKGVTPGTERYECEVSRCGLSWTDGVSDVGSGAATKA